MHGICIYVYIYAHVDDLDLDERRGHRGYRQRQEISVGLFRQLSRQRALNLIANMTGHCLRDLDLANVNMTWPSCYFISVGLLLANRLGNGPVADVGHWQRLVQVFGVTLIYVTSIWSRLSRSRLSHP